MSLELEEALRHIKDLRSHADVNLNKIHSRIDTLEQKMNRPPLFDPQQFALDPNRTEELRGFGKFLRGGKESLDSLEVKTLLVGSDPSFGFACPPEMEREIIHSLTEGSPLRGEAKRYQTDKNSLEVLKKSASGAVVLQSAEVGEILETTGLAYERLTFTPKTEVYLLKQSLVHAEDTAFPMEGEISLELGEAFGTYEAAAHITGTEGIIANIGDGTLNTYNHTHAGSTTVITGDNIINLTYAIPTRFLPNAKFIMSRTVMAYIRTLKDGVTGSFLWQPSLLGGEGARGRETLCGYPVILDDNMPAMTSALYPIGFGDWSKAFAIVDHSPGFQVQRLVERYAEYGIIGFLARFRTTSGPLDGAAAHFLQMST